MERTIFRDESGWLEFVRPVRILEATRPWEVLDALREAEEAARRSQHVVGFISYEAASAFDPALRVRAGGDFPLCRFGVFGEPRRIELPRPSLAGEAPTWLPSMERTEYGAAFSRLMRELGEGNCYQANLTFRLRARLEADPWELFLRMADQGGAHSAYIESDRWVIASGSPELFLEIDGQRLRSRPMKGTIARGLGSAGDIEAARVLRGSEKNRAENLMIVDMIRNDLGRIARPGSVEVSELFSVERYPTLWQMTSTVDAVSQAPLHEIVQAVFPCASITGAPKVSAMGIIADLETSPRRIYTGSVVHITPCGKARFSVAIRTLLYDRETRQAEYGVGGGVVWDSTPESEYEEAMLKSRLLSFSDPSFSLLETMLWTPERDWVLLDEHADRLLSSAGYFSYPVDRKAILRFLSSFSEGFDAPRRARVLLSPDGVFSGESAPFSLEGEARVMRARLAAGPIDPMEPLLYHKTTMRPWYEEARRDLGDFDDILFYNPAGELTEFSYGNLLVEKDGEFLTPPVDCGLLPGTFRARLLQNNEAREARLRVEDIKSCRRIFFINSVRGRREINISL